MTRGTEVKSRNRSSNANSACVRGSNNASGLIGTGRAITSGIRIKTVVASDASKFVICGTSTNCCVVITSNGTVRLRGTWLAISFEVGIIGRVTNGAN